MPADTIEWGTLRQNFLEGKTAIMWHSTGNLTIVKKKAQFDFGVAMLPASKRRGTPTGGGNFYIFKKTSAAERKAAMRLIKVHDQPRAFSRMVDEDRVHGCQPGGLRNQQTESVYQRASPYAAVARDQLKFATAELSTYQTGRIRKALDDAIQAALTRCEISSADALKRPSPCPNDC